MKKFGIRNKLDVIKNAGRKGFVREEKQNCVLRNFCGERELATIVAWTNALAKFIALMAKGRNVKGKNLIKNFL